MVSLLLCKLWFRLYIAKVSTGFCRIFATGMVLLWSRPIVLATTLPNKEGSGVLGLQGSVAKILQNPVQSIQSPLELESLFPKTTLYITTTAAVHFRLVVRKIGKSLK